MNNILFDEKVDGSFYLTLGRYFDEADNGNQPVIHWDLILTQRAKFEKRDIYFDGTLIRKDGCFVLPILNELNPEKLIENRKATSVSNEAASIFAYIFTNL